MVARADSTQSFDGYGQEEVPGLASLPDTRVLESPGPRAAPEEAFDKGAYANGADDVSRARYGLRLSLDFEFVKEHGPPRLAREVRFAPAPAGEAIP